MPRRTWTNEQRAAQAEKMRKQKIWELSTGPKTTKGKQKVAQNGRKNATGKNLTKDEYIALIKQMNPKLVEDSELLEEMLSGITFKDDKATKKPNKDMTVVNGVFREVKRDMWTIKDVETARKKVDVIIKRLSQVVNMTMDTCQQLHNLHKKYEYEYEAAQIKKRASFNNPFPKC
ncbi:hypothetical protein [Agitococcus lubricus]|uniref:Uncharacterized protein n=1 Tax=Agitococcus lubricus TaxID=1077255 RepID=A0A2T5ITL2_9GAMM|nr:hypothetical protein [Agitococcus lubricus]PTQ87204.1 hypothetical protein C8N29_1207 [Agitococcus lubricus]